jgi:hypothetical protein
VPLRLADLTKETKTAILTFAGTADTLTVTYRLRAHTPAIAAEVRAAVAEDRTLDAIVCRLLTTVTAWDLLDDEGQTIPLTEAGLAGVASDVLLLIWDGLLADMRPDPTPAASSGGTSLQPVD